MADYMRPEATAGRGSPDPGAVRSPVGAETKTVALVSVALVFIRHKWLFLLVPVGVLMGLAADLLSDPVYRADSAFSLGGAGSDEGSSFQAVAAQFGLAGAGSGESLSFYADLIETRAILKPAVQTSYSLEGRDGSARSGDLIRLLEIEGDVAEATKAAMRELRSMVNVQVDAVSGMVNVYTSAPWPELAEALNARLLELLNEFNLAKRQSRAKREREFVEARLEEARRELNESERNLQEFYIENRRFEGSPLLQVEEARLQRDIALKQQLVSSLAVGLQSARIDEVRNTPVLTIVEGPEGSALRADPGSVRSAGIGGALGILLAVVLALGAEYVRAERRLRPNAYEELRREVRSPGRMRKGTVAR